MRYDVKISAEAETDLRNIFEYIAFDLQSVQSAADVLARLEDSIYSLAEMPKRYPKYRAEPWFSRGLRYMAAGNYCIFYMAVADVGEVDIARVMYGGQDIQATLEKLAGQK